MISVGQVTFKKLLVKVTSYFFQKLTKLVTQLQILKVTSYLRK